MTPDLIWLTLSGLMAASLWIPFIIGVNMNTEDTQAAFIRPPNHNDFPAWVHRAYRAHLNMIETFVPFAALVLIGYVSQSTGQITLWAAIAFFWLRLAHAIGMISGRARFPVRPILFTASWLCTVTVGIDVLV